VLRSTQVPNGIDHQHSATASYLEYDVGYISTVPTASASAIPAVQNEVDGQEQTSTSCRAEEDKDHCE